jgi:hypothetical protein
MAGKSAAGTDIVAAHFVDLVPNERVVYADLVSDNPGSAGQDNDVTLYSGVRSWQPHRIWKGDLS